METGFWRLMGNLLFVPLGRGMILDVAPPPSILAGAAGLILLAGL